MDSPVLFMVWMLTVIDWRVCQSIEIVAEPPNGVVGGSVQFRLIDPLSAPPDSFKWSFGSTLICSTREDMVGINPEYGSRLTANRSTAAITLQNLTTSDTGQYTLDITIDGAASNDTTTFTVFDKPGLVVIKGEGRVNVGENIDLICSAECAPDCTYTWILNGGHEIGTGPSYIAESVYEGSGNYTCTASNTAGTKKGDLYVYVKEPRPVGVMVAIGIGCTVLGIITGIGISRCLVKIKWFREFLLGGTDQNPPASGISQERKNTGNQHQQSQ